MNGYQATIRKHLKARDIDPRHIEAYMRLQYSTLDHLDADTFAYEVDICVLCIVTDGTANAESLARSYGL